MKILKFKKADVEALFKSVSSDNRVTLVGDHGVYLMSRGMKIDAEVYAEGCHPKLDEDFYDNKRDLFGGDDGFEDIGPVGELLPIVAQSTKYLLIKLKSTTIEVVSDLKPTKVRR